ncbi:Bestrophin, RFP-TM, chloride channel family protein [Penicillium ucsense]|uniref:Bestrophin, RFP-TM, chloride channel family protein n=1 Tax=Penicillium ucsense TaxID=2839758 RepID=A0A8J8WJ47_9EURO|nr:Bestrophin, RFP-TM, chloride channel family protein [Penicillium ucsense]KAF7737476.1 Bestrophin, RFP-TM, chloride channel family protein [Penicillium ucsense]
MRLNFSEPGTPTLSRQSTFTQGRHHQRRLTHPHLLSSRRKPRRWPLVFRFIKGAIHAQILVSVFLHALFTAFVVYLDNHVFETVVLPPSIIPSLSIVVGLMLVFRNQTSYNRFWDGRNAMSTMNTCLRNLTRTIVTNSYSSTRGPPNLMEREDIERTLRVLIAIPFAVKNHLRAEWGAAWATDSTHGGPLDERGTAAYNPDYAGLLPAGLEGHEHEGLGLPYQLTYFVDGFIKRGEDRGWFNAPGASQMQAQLNTFLDAYGRMETIKLTPMPVAHLIHQKQVLALFGCVLPFAMVDQMGWWAIPIVCLVIFTLYGIEGIGSQLEDPFGYDRNDIKMDALVGDTKIELDVVMNEWRTYSKAMEGAWRAAENVNGHGERCLDGAPKATTAANQGQNTREKYNPPDLFIRRRPQVTVEVG